MKLGPGTGSSFPKGSNLKEWGGVKEANWVMPITMVTRKSGRKGAEVLDTQIEREKDRCIYRLFVPNLGVVDPHENTD